MKTRLDQLPLTACALATVALMLSACGGGGAEAPPAGPTNTPDTTAPVATITDNVSAATATGDITFAFTFNEDVGTSFTADDVTVTGGTKGAFVRLGGTGATLVVTPTANSTGTVEVSLAAGRVTDAAGNGNAVTSSLQAFNTVVSIPTTRLMTFSESPAPTLVGFGGSEDATVVVDPAGGTNMVAKVVKAANAESWAGATMVMCPNNAMAPMPFTATLQTLTARVWSPTAGIPVRMKLESVADNTKTVETEATTTVADAWETLTFNFANHATNTPALNLAATYNRASVFFNFGKNGAESGGAKTYYIDDLSFQGSVFTPSCTIAPPPPTSNTTSITMDEGTAPVLTGFGGAEDATIAADPTNTANKVAKIVKSGTAQTWAGTTISTGSNLSIGNIAFSDTAKTITVRVYAPAAGKVVRLKVENAANNAMTVETEATTTVGAGWQTMTFNFANQAPNTAALNLASTYNKLSIFPAFGTAGVDGGGGTWYIEDIVYPSGTTPPPTNNTPPVTLNFDDTAKTFTFTGFGGAEDASKANDPAGGTNQVAKIVKSATAQTWAGTTISTGANLSIDRVQFSSTSKTMTMRVYAAVANKPIRLKLENAADNTMTVETEATPTVAGAWQTLTFNFAVQATNTAALNLASTYNKLSIFPNFGTSGGDGGGGTWYFDDITFTP
jgi:Bacterial Ig-like domain